MHFSVRGSPEIDWTDLKRCGWNHFPETKLLIRSPWHYFAGKLTAWCPCVLRLMDMSCAAELPWNVQVCVSAVGQVFSLHLSATQHFFKGKLLTDSNLCVQTQGSWSWKNLPVSLSLHFVPCCVWKCLVFSPWWPWTHFPCQHTP